MTNFNAPHGGTPPIQVGSRQDTILSAMTDFGFTRFVTPKLLRILYILGIIVIVFMAFMPLVMNVVVANFVDSSFGSTSVYDSYDPYGTSMSSSSDDESLGAGRIVGLLISGVFNAFLQICLLRISLEALHAFITTSQAWARIKNRVEAGTASF